MAHRRRGVGVGRTGASQYTQRKADEIKAISVQSALETVEQLERHLTQFAQEHQQEIRRDAVFRQRFLEMCAPLGVDPLTASKKSFWGQLLGMGDFYHQLAMKVAEVCLASRPRNGGLMSLPEVQRLLSQRSTRFGSMVAGSSSVGSSTTATATSTVISASDIKIAIQKLAVLGGGFRILAVGDTLMVVSVPMELDQDMTQLLTLAQQPSTGSGGGGGLSVETLIQSLGWTRPRIERALQLLLQEGMAWLDTHQGVDYYWFPSIWEEQQLKEEIDK